MRPPLPTFEIAWPEPNAGHSARDFAHIAAAMIVHAALAFALVERMTLIGGHGRDVDAIGIEIVVAARALDRRTTDQNGPSAATDRPTGVTEGAADDALPSDAAPDSRLSDREPSKAEPDEPALIDSAPAADALPPDSIVDVASPAPTDAPPNSRAPTAAPANSAPAEHVFAALQGGAALSGRDLVEQMTAAEALARAGVKSRYGADVYVALRKSPPVAPAGQIGKVTVQFGLNADGAVNSTRVAVSSGAKAIDDAAIAAVRRAKFPIPPAALKAADLVYAMEYTFR